MRALLAKRRAKILYKLIQDLRLEWYSWCLGSWCSNSDPWAETVYSWGLTDWKGEFGLLLERVPSKYILGHQSGNQQLREPMLSLEKHFLNIKVGKCTGGSLSKGLNLPSGASSRTSIWGEAESFFSGGKKDKEDMLLRFLLASGFYDPPPCFLHPGQLITLREPWP